MTMNYTSAYVGWWGGGTREVAPIIFFHYIYISSVHSCAPPAVSSHPHHTHTHDFVEGCGIINYFKILHIIKEEP
jgi:hypothetical protein